MKITNEVDNMPNQHNISAPLRNKTKQKVITTAQEIYCLTAVILTVLVSILVGYIDRKTLAKLCLESYLQLLVVFY